MGPLEFGGGRVPNSLNGQAGLRGNQDGGGRLIQPQQTPG